MAGLSYEESKKFVYRGLWLLAAVTLVEVAVSLFGKGHIIAGMEDNMIVFILSALIIAALSLYKAYFIVYDFMHMRHEAKGLAKSVLLPMGLLVWAIIAFFQEGDSWKNRRQNHGNYEKAKVEEAVKQESFNAKEMKVIEKF